MSWDEWKPPNRAWMEGGGRLREGGSGQAVLHPPHAQGQGRKAWKSHRLLYSWKRAEKGPYVPFLAPGATSGSPLPLSSSNSGRSLHIHVHVCTHVPVRVCMCACACMRRARLLSVYACMSIVSLRGCLRLCLSPSISLPPPTLTSPPHPGPGVTSDPVPGRLGHRTRLLQLLAVPSVLLPEAGAQRRPWSPHQWGGGQALHPTTTLSKRLGQPAPRPPSTPRQHYQPTIEFSSLV